ncbi:hypothetical protein DSOL_2506 [Desulfosporosinus metallidurans]|uniref:Uncharacterized protein n=1 Tax=Desulfosporosinus metallidurans TaxID=1888891 RepID=A0A1Q8QWB8_9FIRM|nr:hypothetical protein DSOL_2506 [Desulfosporosinus metallidurans]
MLQGGGRGDKVEALPQILGQHSKGREISNGKTRHFQGYR